MEYALEGHGYSRARVFLARLLEKPQKAEDRAWMRDLLDRALVMLDSAPMRGEPAAASPPPLLATLRSLSPPGPVNGCALIVANAVKAVFDDLYMQGCDLRIAQCSIEANASGGEHMLVCAYFPSLTAEVQQGDSVVAGVMIALRGDPAEECRLEILPRVYRKICTNGTVVFSGDAAAHEIPSRLIWEAAPRGPLASAITQAIRGCLSSAVFEAAVRGFRQSASARIRLSDAIGFLSRSRTLSREIRSAVLQRFLETGDFTRWGLINAMTAEARIAPSIVQLTLERSGGALANASTASIRSSGIPNEREHLGCALVGRRRVGNAA